MTLKRKLFAAPVLALGLVVGSSSSAYAFHCINASRSAQGEAGAAKSNGWFTLTLTDLFTDAVENFEEFGLPEADLSQVPAMVAAAEAAGVPSSFTVNAHTTAAQGTLKKEGAKQADDGKGIDFFDAVYLDRLIGAYLSVAGG